MKELLISLGYTSAIVVVFTALIQLPIKKFQPAAIRKTASSETFKIWRNKPSFTDDFTRPASDPDGCYSLSRPMYCYTAHNTPYICPGYPNDPIFSNELKDLNRCTWIPEHFPYQGDKEGERFNTKSFKNVEVKNGVLKLKFRSQPQFFGNTECGKDYTPDVWGGPFNVDCPFVGAQVLSNPKPNENVKGAAAKFGRFEARAKLGMQPNAWPALWMLPTDGPWPEAGELDLMESFRGKYWKVDCTFHSGPQTFKKGKEKHPQIEGEFERSKNDRYYVDQWHVYGVEWTPHQVRFTVDEQECLSFTRNNSKGAWMPKEIPFYWLLGVGAHKENTSGDIERGESDYAQYTDFEIDSVKNYDACEKDVDFCDVPDSYNNTPGGERCELGSMPTPKSSSQAKSNISFEVSKTKVTYAPVGGSCPWGEAGAGVLESGKCVYLKRDDEYNIYQEGSNLYSHPRCADYRNLNAEYLEQLNAGDDNHCKFVQLPYPNPYQASNGTLKFTFGLSRPSYASFEVIDTLGRLVYENTDYQGEVLQPGEYKMAWNGEINGGNTPASAMYLIRMKCTDAASKQVTYGNNSTKKVVMIK